MGDSRANHPRPKPDELSDRDFRSLGALHLPGEVPFQERASWSGDAVSEEAPDPLIGSTLHETYVVSRILGVGGMGRVYEAQHTRIRTKRFAIKVLHSEFSRDPEIRLRFQREAEAAATIEHDGVVGTYDIGETPQGWPYMVCEFLAGLDLKDYLKQHGPLPPQAIAHIGRQLCSALGAAHARGVIHRDLKPQNVFVLDPHESTPEGHETEDTELPTVKVLDFGLSRFVESENELTKTGIILGTPGYMAPEQANGRETDLRTDIYGIGALLYATATGQAPFKEETPQLTVLAVMNREPPRPRDIRSDLPLGLEIIIQKAMAREPNERFQSSAHMGAELFRLYESSSQLNRRTRRARARHLFDPRTTLIFYAVLAFTLGSLSLGGATLATLEASGFKYTDYHPSSVEWLLLSLLGVFILFPVALALRHFKRQIWGNSARVAELAGTVRASLLAAIVAYGASALILWLGATLRGIARGHLSPSELTSSLRLYSILPANAALGAIAVALWESCRGSGSAWVRAVARVFYPAIACVVALWLVALPFREAATEPQTTWPHTLASARAPEAPSTSVSDSKASAPSAPPAPSPEDQATPRGSQPGSESAALPAPTHQELAVAMQDGPEALEALHSAYPQNREVLKALVLSHASRADTIDRSVKAIAKLLKLDPEARRDGDLVFILKKALLAIGKPHDVAALTVKTQMGEDGAELLYQLMSEHPEQRSRLSGLFQELRKAKKASREVSIAYDLRYASSCQGRLPLLSEAEQHGDLRSLRQLQALSTAPKRCGWGRTCYPPCRAEAERFRQSAKVIGRRLEAPPL